MITAQDIREKGFEVVRFNGYDRDTVDDFLEELADDVAATQKENAVLKSKMKVLVDKIEEYRANEEALNNAILSAQKLAVQIESEARQRAAATIAEAEQKAQETIGSITDRANFEEKRLADAKAAAAKYIAAATMWTRPSAPSRTAPQSSPPIPPSRSTSPKPPTTPPASASWTTPRPSLSDLAQISSGARA